MNYLPSLDNKRRIIEEIEFNKSNIISLKKRLKTELKKERNANKKQQVANKIILGIGADCHKCGKPMRRKGHRVSPNKFHYIKWDVCSSCHIIKHYEEFKSEDWKEYDRQREFIKFL